MKIYKFYSYGWKDKLYEVDELDVEEKPNSYVGNRKSPLLRSFRVLKSEINLLRNGIGDVMYCLTPDPKFYIRSVIAKREAAIKILETRLEREKEALKKWIEAEEKL